MMPERGGSMITLTVWRLDPRVADYNVMGVAKARWKPRCANLLPISVRAILRVKHHLGGPIRTLAGAGIAEQREMLKFQQLHAPLRRTSR